MVILVKTEIRFTVIQAENGFLISDEITKTLFVAKDRAELTTVIDSILYPEPVAKGPEPVQGTGADGLKVVK